MRGAYEAGVLSGVVDVLKLEPSDPAPFRILAGTSVGGLNAAFLAANAHRGDMGVGELVSLWTGLRLSRTLRFRSRALLGLLGRRAWTGSRATRSLVAPTFLEEIVRERFDWQRLHRNVREGVVKALLIPALEIATGQTTVFAELAPGVELQATTNPRRRAQVETITDQHVLGSTALPLVFPARRIGRHYYCDGGLRFNTPIAPALRCGADRLLVISLKHEPESEADVPEPADDEVAEYPSVPFLLGKILNALLLDPVSYDLQVLERFNRLIETLERSLSPAEMDEIARLMTESRGAPYRRIDTLAFSPSRDVGAIATEHARRCLDETSDLDWLVSSFLKQVASARYERAGDLAAYILFDGRFAADLIDLGRRDVHRRASEVRRFFER